jgi:hypothetical protein
MRVLRLSMLAVIVPALAGCGLGPLRRVEDQLTGTVRWVKPGAPPGQLEQDRAVCLTEAARGPDRSAESARFRACMESRGYVRE